MVIPKNSVSIPKSSALLSGRRGVSTVTVLFFTAFVVLPLMLLGLGIGRFLHVRNTLSTAADAAALAAALDVDIPYYRETGEIRFAPYVYQDAQDAALANASWLIARKVYPRVVEIGANSADRTVLVVVGADATDLFGIVGNVWIQARSTAEVAALHVVYPEP